MNYKLWLTTPDGYLKGEDANLALNQCDSNSKFLTGEGWVFLQEIDIDVDVHQEKLLIAALDRLDAKEEKLRAVFTEELASIQSQRSDLQALTYKPDCEVEK